MRRNAQVRSAIALSAATAMIFGGAAAHADDLRDTLTGSAERVTISSGGSATVTYYIHANGGDGCNVDAANPGTMSPNAPAGVTATPAMLQFTNCGENVQSKTVVYTSSTQGTYTILPTMTGGKTGNNGWDNSQADISLTVSTAAKQNQTIALVQPASPQAYGNSFSVAPTASSGLPVTLAAAGGCTVTSGTVTMTSGTTDCTLTASQAGNTAYNAAANVVRTVAAQPRAVTVAADTKFKVYGQDEPALTYTAQGLIGNDTLSGALARAAGNDAGTYAITQGTLAAGANYSITSFTGANFAIGQKTVTVTADAKSKVYGQNDPALTYTAQGLIGTDTLSGALARAAGNDAGTYAITQGTLAAGANYSINSFTGANFTIGQKTVTVTADAKSKVYGQNDPALTYTAQGLIGTDTLSGALARAAGSDAGTYAITQGTVSAGSNYDISFTGANLTVTAKPITVTADAKSKVYGQNDPELTYTTPAGALVGDDTLSGSLTRDDGSNVGTYEITQGTVGAGSNYDISFTGANLTVTAKPITVTADAKSKVYGQNDPELTYTTPAGALVGDDTLSGSLTRDDGSNVGTYEITQGTVSAGSNYDISFTGANLTVTAKPITVTADAKSKVYGQNDPELTYTTPAGALVGNDTLSGSLTRDDGSNVGTYEITQGTVSAGSNYDISFTGANLTVTAKPITVTADAKSKVYGDDDPTLTHNGTLLAGDKFTGALTRDAGSNVGTYAITRGTLNAGDNYDLTFVPGQLTITAKQITVTADGKSKVFGQADPALTYTAGALLGDDSFTGSLSRIAGEKVGTYAIGLGTLTAGNNYAIQFTAADFKITAWTYGAGFKSPVSMDSNKVNQLKGGSSVPLKFNVFAGGNEVTANVGTVFAKTAACDAGDASVSVPVEATGSTSLRYDTTGGQWIYNWKAPTALGCYKVGLTLTDGTVLTTDFRVTK